jgi:hypothetical protein
VVSQESSPGTLVSFLAVHGLHLMILELRVSRSGLLITWGLNGSSLQVIWVIGLPIIFVGLLLGTCVPPRVIGLVGALILLGHTC